MAKTDMDETTRSQQTTINFMNFMLEKSLLAFTQVLVPTINITQLSPLHMCHQ